MKIQENYKLTLEETRKILNDLIETIENNPNNMELGDILRKKYWKELKDIKSQI